MAIMEISVIPVGTGTTSLSRYVASIVKLIHQSGLPYRLNDMGTVVVGETNSLFRLAEKIHNAAFSKDVRRVYTIVKLDERRDKTVRLGDKTRSVENRS